MNCDDFLSGHSMKCFNVCLMHNHTFFIEFCVNRNSVEFNRVLMIELSWLSCQNLIIIIIIIYYYVAAQVTKNEPILLL